MTAQHIIIVILSSLLVLSAAESLYSRACSGGDPPPACKQYCELCQTGCLPPGKTLTTKTFYDVCNEEQKLQFEKERDEKTKICQEFMDGLSGGSETDPDNSKNTNNNENNNGDQKGREDDVASSAKIIDDVYNQIKNTPSIILQIFTAIIGIFIAIIVMLISQIRAEKRKLAIAKERAREGVTQPANNNTTQQNNNININSNNINNEPNQEDVPQPLIPPTKWDEPYNTSGPNNTEQTSDGETHHEEFDQ